MSTPMTDKISRWSLDRVRFLLAHVGEFVESDPDRELRARAQTFQPQTGLDDIERLTLAEPNDPRLPTLILERLAAFFDAGTLLQSPEVEDGWRVTDLFGRGAIFHLEDADQLAAGHVVPALSPLQVHHAAAADVLAQLKLGFLLPAPDARAYVIRPTPTVAFLLISNLAPPFAVDHVARAHELVNQGFLY